MHRPPPRATTVLLSNNKSEVFLSMGSLKAFSHTFYIYIIWIILYINCVVCLSVMWQFCFFILWQNWPMGRGGGETHASHRLCRHHRHSELLLPSSKTRKWWRDTHQPSIIYIYIIKPKQAYPDLTVLCRFFDGISSVLWPSIPSKLKTKGHNSLWEFSKEKVLWFVTNSQKLRTWGSLILPQVFKNSKPEVLWFVTNFQKPRIQGSFICWRKTLNPKSKNRPNNKGNSLTTEVLPKGL